MNCYVSGIVGLGMLFASYSTMSISKQEKNRLLNVFPPELDRIYIKISNERRNIYFQGCSAVKSITIGNNFTISGLAFLENCFENQNVELVIGYNYTGYPIYIPQKIFNVNKYGDIKHTLLYDQNKCMISYDEFNDDSDIVVLHCGHVLSLESLNQLIKIQKFCPLCRQPI